jgi:hypothetical protein
MSTEKQLHRISEKLQQLVKEYAQLQKENHSLKLELKNATDKADNHQKNAEELKQQVGILKMNAGEMSEVDKKDFEKKINVYLKEIDRCIALLSE